MKHKNTCFSLKLFLESFRQLRLVGITGLALLSIAAVIIPLNTANNLQNAQMSSVKTLGGLQMHPALFAVFYLFVPLMTILAFRFLDKRNESDFYFSAPFTRECLFLCRLCAVLSWTVILILGSSAVSVISFRVLCSQVILNGESFWFYLFNTFAACVFAAGAFCIAMSITGTLFSNIMVATLLIFVPRILIFVVTNSLRDIPFVFTRSLPLVLDSSWNVFTHPVFQFVNVHSNQDSAMLQTAPAAIYTLCVGIFYSAVGCTLFHLRKTENAEKPAPNKRLQAIFRIMLSLAFTLPCCATLFGQLSFGQNELLIYVVWYSAAIVVYFLYELLTTKKLRRLLPIAPGFLIVLALNGIVIGSMSITYHSEINFTPNENQITRVNIQEKTNLNGSWNPHEDYFAAKLADLPIQDKTVNEILSRNLKNMVSSFHQYSTSSRQSWAYEYEQLYPYCQTFRIHCGGTSKLRKICMNQTDWDALVAVLTQNSAFQTVYQEIPPLGTSNLTISYSTESTLSEKSIAAVYNTLRDEAKEINFDQWYNALGRTANTFATGGCLHTLSFSASVGIHSTDAWIDLNPLLLPKTCTAYLKAWDSIHDTLATQLSKVTLDQYGNPQLDGETLFISLHFINNDLNSYNFSLGQDDTLTLIQQLIKENSLSHYDSAGTKKLYLPLPEGETSEALVASIQIP